MKKLFIGSLLFSLLLSTPAYAVTTEDLKAAIDSLSKNVKALRTVMGAQAGSLPGDVDTEEMSPCLNLVNNLRYRARDAQTGGEVSLLQDFLQAQGYLNSEPTGYFGLLTLSAAKEFQRDNLLSPTGFVGPLTRARISATSCGLGTSPSSGGGGGGVGIPVPIQVLPQSPGVQGGGGGIAIPIPIRGGQLDDLGGFVQGTGKFAAIQFKVPAGVSGPFDISAVVAPMTDGALSHDADFSIILNNSTELFSKLLNPNEGTRYGNSVSLSSGDTLDFLVGRGADGLHYGSGLKVAVKIVSNVGTNSYDLSGGFPVGVNPSGPWAVGYKTEKTSLFKPFTRTFRVPDDNVTLVESWRISRTVMPSIYFNNSQSTVAANGCASQFPPGTVWMSAGFEPGYGDKPVPPRPQQTVYEQVKCVFDGATTEQGCYASSQSPADSATCSGVGACVANVNGNPGTPITWKSTCGGYAYTTIDGNNEYANFNCGGNQPVGAPVIQGLDAPISLVVGQTGTWTVRAYDPQNVSLSYSVVWGDEGFAPAGIATPEAMPIIQNTTFTHIYRNAGTFTPVFTVRNASGQSARTSATVQVGGGGTSTNTSPKIVGIPSVPQGIQPGQIVNFSWSATDADNDDLSWSVSFGDSGGASSCSSVRRQTRTGWTYNTSHTWLQAGTYQVRAGVSDCVGGNDSNSFSVTVGTQTTQPSITVTSPWSGGEKVAAESVYTVRWKSASIPVTNDMKVFIISKSQGYSQMIMNGPNIGYLPITIPSQLNGDYEFMVQTSINGQIYSGSSFAYIIPPTSQPSIIVTAPNGGEVWQAGNVHSITWNSSNLSGSTVSIVAIESCGTCEARLISLGANVQNNGFYSWAIPANMQGQWRVRISSGSALDHSDAPFTITSVTSQPSITVTSPNGGESFALGAQIPVTWTQTFSAQATRVYLIDTASRNMYTSPALPNVSGANHHTIPGNSFPAAGNYRVNICSQVGLTNYCDPSNGYFTVTSSTSQTPT